MKIGWPGARTFHGLCWKLLSGGLQDGWMGSLKDGHRDASGQMYRRNRYYDPQSGRFTQEDPIGLAGGLNLYGFANGDPVNFSDPFGLCPEGDRICQNLVAELRSLEGSLFQRAADVFEQFQGRVLLVDRDLIGGAEAVTNNRQQTVRFAQALTQDRYRGDFLIVAVHESFHLNEGGGFTERPNARARGFIGGVKPREFWLGIKQEAFDQLPLWLQTRAWNTFDDLNRPGGDSRFRVRLRRPPAPIP